MILAAPLVIPFAEAVGISIATLGMAKAADMVNDYIQENPEQSAMILKTLVPNLGIGEIFMKKGKDEEVEEEVSVEDIDPKDLTKEEKAKMMKELAKSGTSREKMIKGYEEIIQPGEDRTLVDAEERYDEGGVEDAPKPKFDYKKFFRNRRADGGAIGIEVLFEEKKPRKNFFMGGPALEGQALSIYNSMNAYGFDDQAIANALTEQGLYTPGGTTPDTPSDNIIGSQINQGGGGEGIMELQETFRTEPGDPKNFRLSQLEGTTDYFPPTTMMGKTKNFIQEKFFQPKVRGTLGDRLLKQSQSMTIPTLTGAFAKLRSPFNPESPTYNPNLPSQLNFLEGSPMVTRTTGQFINPKLGAVEGNFMTTTGALIGRDPNTGSLKYGPGSVLSGKNVISGFGTNDYEKSLMDYITKMSANTKISAVGKAARLANAKAELAKLTGQNVDDINIDDINTQIKIAKTNKISAGEAAGIMAAIQQQNEPSAPGRNDAGNPGGTSGGMTDDNAGTFCFDPSTPIQMADGSTKEIKNIQLGDDTKGGEVTGVFQFKASDEIHDYKGVTVAGSHYVKEDGKFIMVKDSPLSVKIDKIPVVYSLDTTGRRIFIKDIEFADYNGDGVAKNFLTNAGVDLTGFDTEVLRQVENRLI